MIVPVIKLRVPLYTYEEDKPVRMGPEIEEQIIELILSVDNIGGWSIYDYEIVEEEIEV